MRMLFILLIIVFSFLSLSSELSNTNEMIDEELREENTFSGSALASRDDMVKYGTPYQAKALVDEAMSYMNENGTEKAFKAFTSKDERFHYKDLYIFVFDMDGNMLCHGAEKELIGKNLIDLKDSAGKYFVKDFIKLMDEADDGWIEYFWRNYENLKVEMKLTYLKKFDDNIFLGCGAYQPRY